MDPKAIAASLVLLVLLFGCTQNLNTIDAQKIFEIQKFLKENPGLSFSGVVQSESQVAADDLFAANCAGQAIKEYYKVTISDVDGQLNGVAWIDSNSAKLVCFYKKAFVGQAQTGEINIGKSADDNQTGEHLARFVATTRENTPAENVVIQVSSGDTNQMQAEKRTNGQGIADFYLANGDYFFNSYFISSQQVYQYISGESFRIQDESVKIELKIRQALDLNQNLPDANSIPDYNGTVSDSNQSIDYNYGVPDLNQDTDRNYFPDLNQSVPDYNQINDYNVPDYNQINDSNGSDLNTSDSNVLSCQFKALGELRCSGNWLQNKYQNTDCSTYWSNYMNCTYGCSNNVCQNPPSANGNWQVDKVGGIIPFTLTATGSCPTSNCTIVWGDDQNSVVDGNFTQSHTFTVAKAYMLTLKKSDGGAITPFINVTAIDANQVLQCTSTIADQNAVLTGQDANITVHVIPDQRNRFGSTSVNYSTLCGNSTYQSPYSCFGVIGGYSNCKYTCKNFQSTTTLAPQVTQLVNGETIFATCPSVTITVN